MNEEICKNEVSIKLDPAVLLTRENRQNKTQTFLKVGKAATLIHTIKGSLRKPLLEGFSGSSSYGAIDQDGGFTVPGRGKCCQ